MVESSLSKFREDWEVDSYENNKKRYKKNASG